MRLLMGAGIKDAAERWTHIERDGNRITWRAEKPKPTPRPAK